MVRTLWLLLGLTCAMLLLLQAPLPIPPLVTVGVLVVSFLMYLRATRSAMRATAPPEGGAGRA